MAYIGKSPAVGNFVKLDAITTSSTNTYNLTLDSVAFTPESANHMLVSLNGVIQAPLTSFSVSGSTITFLPSSGTLSSSDSIDFIMVYGNVLDIGTPSDSTVTNAKTNFVSTSSSAGLQIKGDNTTAGTLQLNCEQNSHGIKLQSPPHSANQSYTLKFPSGNVTAGKVLKVDSVSGSGTTGIGTLTFGDAGGANTPAFMASLSSPQNVSDNTNTKVQADSELFDTDNAYDNSSNYRFTPQTAGKYFVFGAVFCDPQTASDLVYGRAYIYKNGSFDKYSTFDFRNTSGREVVCFISYIVDMNGSSDYLELYGNVNASDNSGTRFGNNHTYFGAYKLIT